MTNKTLKYNSQCHGSHLSCSFGFSRQGTCWILPAQVLPVPVGTCEHCWAEQPERGLWASAAVVEGAVVLCGLFLFCGKTPD